MAGGAQPSNTAYSDAERQRDEIFTHDLTDAVLNPEFQRFMTTMQSEYRGSDSNWSSWEQAAPAADEFVLQLERALAALGDTGPPGGSGLNNGNSEPSFQELVEQLGLAGDVSKEQLDALAAAPQLTQRLISEVEALLERQRAGTDTAACLSQ
uniref:Uncharacterized protein n=1 Tax=Pyrodinium bahamense TaxID=73915 RepID=A0A7S0AJD3_9DINO|mmetsp:Transcript_35583/g.98530  ORF Transcript_35583/g.98530 Transcript_35583/m.98530 type:complete len:153 (+) Transcript_35583:105-563(+)|eukprot:CAMPEP_0179119080 /NCGR_PEP_ID=MMETSP0796-20121207/56041_1 /TAXON_ID=73915 /ORGANISM="Pyrodinium bahamense, Strain pbaha01" /LENGTH=152 /DNA_ID=CAMNT_0020817571 /DNA_START=105 /DNA_END=563 /DNA_ORIENTATION=+